MAIAGATGGCGLEIVRAAKAAGLRTRALIRTGAKLVPIRQCVDEQRHVYVTDPDSVRGTLDGADMLVSAVGKTRQQDDIDRRAVDVGANLNLIAEAQRAGVGRIGFVSVHGCRPDHPSAMVRMKAEVEQALRDSGIPHVIVRPTGFFSDMWDLFEMVRRGTLWVVGDPDAHFNPISLPDLGEYIVSAVLDDANLGQVVSVGGPEVLSWREIGGLAEEVLGVTARVRRMPIWMARAGVALMRPFNKGSWEVAQFMTANIRQMNRDRDAMVAPATGTRTLGAYFAERYAAEQASKGGAKTA